MRDRDAYDRNKAKEEARRKQPFIKRWKDRLSNPDRIAQILLCLFTFGLFAATVGLYFATRHLVVDAENTAERQLRPYLSVKNIEFPCMGCKDWEGRVTAINRGQTPARQVEFLISWDIDPRCGHLNSGFSYHYTDDNGPITYPHAQKMFFEHLRAFSRDDEDSAKFTLSGDLTEASKAVTVCIYGAFLYALPTGGGRDTHFCWWYRPAEYRRDLCEDQNDLD